ncbi:MAG: vitamin K epoxide reductase family protein [candidate division WOR-3 bacterium]|nr:hypothetical protein [candidate division WOR-3 bacterium]MDW8150321.1 vitamin K epoxide reductase family protein [candidate division WOR-3 bacterium]
MTIFRILAFLGLIVSSYLIYAYEFSRHILCIGGGCEFVANSIYSKFLNISLPFWGFMFYLSSFSLSFIKKLEKLLLFMVVVGAIFSLYLTIVEVFIIRSICSWCLISAACSWLMLYILIRNVKK